MQSFFINIAIFYRLTAGTGQAGEVRFSVPCFFHNLMGFDEHLIFSALKPHHIVGRRFQCIPKTMEKYLSFSIGLVDYRDSLQFTMKSVEKLVKQLKPEVCVLS